MDIPQFLQLDLPDLDLIFVEGGVFNMGDETGDLWEACRPVHPVQVSSFYMTKYLLTQRLWERLMGGNPSSFKGEQRPVERVSWLDTQDFLEKLREITGQQFRLPTEAEWEYAARGGLHSQDYLYSGSDKLKQVGWYEENSKNETQEVGLLRSNELGLFDMSGNIWEWCEDWFDDKYYQKCKKQGLVENPVCLAEGTDRVLRGGGCFDEPINCRSTFRFSFGPGYRFNDIGFRLVLPLQSVGKPEGIP